MTATGMSTARKIISSVVRLLEEALPAPLIGVTVDPATVIVPKVDPGATAFWMLF